MRHTLFRWEGDGFHYVVGMFLEWSEVKVNQSHYSPEVPRDFQEVKVPRLRDNGPGC